MRIAIIIARILLGLMFLFASATYFLQSFETPEMHGNIKTFNEGLEASGYMMPLVKFIELICALAFLSGRFVTLANIVLLPITVNILLVHVFMAPEGLMTAVPVFLLHLFLIYAYRRNYVSLFAPKLNSI